MTEFSFVSTSNTVRLADILQKEKVFKTVDSMKYKETNQRDLNKYVRECNAVFEIKSHIYVDDKIKILFVQRLLIDTSANNWINKRKKN
jgi:hypothetical protein